MIRFWTPLQIGFLAVFVITSAAILGYQALFVWPVEKCEANGGWWAPKYHECAQPMKIWQFTGRVPTGTTAAPMPVMKPAAAR